jgi:hypothetical protein
MRNGEYGITHLHIGAIDTSTDDEAILEIIRVEAANQSGQQEIDFNERLENVRRVCQNAARFDDEIRELLEEYLRLMDSGNPLSPEGLRIVTDLQQKISASAADYEVIPDPPNIDFLPTLNTIIEAAPPEPQLDPASIPEEDIILRRRTIAKKRQWCAIRGSSAVRFRRAVGRAYRFTCIICGLRLPPVGGSPGVDAAHILPYAEYDLDDVRNGLCLCKLHHWAFDEGLIEIRHDGSNYVVAVPAQVEQQILELGAGFSLNYLKQNEGIITEDRLPTNSAERPRPELLQKLTELLY